MKLNSTILGQNWTKREIKEDIFKFLELNGNENTAYQYLWDAIKSVVRGRNVTTLKEKIEISQFNNLMICLKE